MVFPFVLSLVLGCETTSKPSTNADDTGGSVDDTGASDGGLPGTTLSGTTARETAPSDADLATLGDSNATFSLDLMRKVHALEQGNYVLSPWSLQVVMSQVYAGAAGDAKTAIGDTFGWTLAEPALHEAFDAADLEIQGHHDPSGDPALIITSTNQIFVSDGYDIGADWLNTLSEFYGTGVQQIDFEADPAGVSDDINAWIATRTGDHIKDLITAEMVASTRMLLVNALYFRASWYVPFSETSTEDRDFTLVDGSTVSASTMSGYINYAGAVGDGFFVFDMPYSDNGLTMTIVLPDADRFEEIATGLDWTTLKAAIDDEEWCGQCEVQLPKFTIEGQPPVQDALIAMGMDAAFGGAYPGISDQLSLSGLDQAGFIAVTEIGTEAAAATVAEFSDSASVPPFGPLHVDRPFLYLVRDLATDNILFGGMVLDPR